MSFENEILPISKIILNENYVSYDYNCTIDKFIVFIEHFKCI
jgi:hypothetical protein